MIISTNLFLKDKSSEGCKLCTTTRFLTLKKITDKKEVKQTANVRAIGSSCKEDKPPACLPAARQSRGHGSSRTPGKNPNAQKATHAVYEELSISWQDTHRWLRKHDDTVGTHLPGILSTPLRPRKSRCPSHGVQRQAGRKYPGITTADHLRSYDIIRIQNAVLQLGACDYCQSGIQ